MVLARCFSPLEPPWVRAGPDPRFSIRIREGLPRMSRNGGRETRGAPTDRGLAIERGQGGNARPAAPDPAELGADSSLERDVPPPTLAARSPRAGRGGLRKPGGRGTVDPAVAHRQLARSATTTGEPSWPTRNHLAERGLLEAFESAPGSRGRRAPPSHGRVGGRRRPPLRPGRARLPSRPGDDELQLSPGRGRLRVRLPVPRGIRGGPRAVRPASQDRGGPLQLGAHRRLRLPGPFGGRAPRRTFPLPIGSIDVAFDPASLRAGNRELHRFTPTTELEVHGLAMRYRRPGLGVPLAAATRPLDPARPGRDLVAPRIQVPVTALLRIPETRRALVEGRPLAATLELHLAWDTETISIAGELVPLETEPSAAFALTFTDVPTLRLELLGFLGRLGGHAAAAHPSRRTGQDWSPSSSCTARSRAWSAGRRCTTASRPTPTSDAASSSGSSITILASPSRCPPFSCARR